MKQCFKKKTIIQLLSSVLSILFLFTLLVPSNAKAYAEDANQSLPENGVNHSILLDDYIGVNFNMELSENVINDEAAYVKFSCNGRTEKVNVKELEGEAPYKLPFYVDADEMQKDIKVEIYTSNLDKPVFTDVYSVEKCANDILKDSDNEDLKKAVNAMMAYGLSADRYLNNVNTVLSEQQKALIDEVTTESFDDFEVRTKGSETLEGVRYRGNSLLLDSKTALRFYFQIPKGKSINDYSVSCMEEGTDTSIDWTTGTKYGMTYVQINNISASDLSQRYTVKFSDKNDETKAESVTDSAMGYAKSMMNKTTTKATLKTTLKAMYSYYSYVNAYIESDDSQTSLDGKIYDGQATAPVIMDSGYESSEKDAFAERSYEQVLRAAGDLRQDIAMVTGAIDCYDVQQMFVDDAQSQSKRLEEAEETKVPKLVTDSSTVDTDYAIIVGDITNSKMIQKMMAEGKLDEAKAIQGSWEAYAIKEVKNPIPGVKNALVIAGSDARGTIYGIYSISEEIGVSPYYWYSDVPVEVKDSIDVDYTEALVDDGPDVKYRGIFINDEGISIKWGGWAKKFPTENGTPDVNYYRRVFEMLLRLKGNLLWPAMKPDSLPFNTAVDENGIPINAKEAAKYGVVMGSSHCEQFLRDNFGEFKTFYEQHKDEMKLNQKALATLNDNIKYQAAYDYTLNKELLLQYWRERLETNKDFESIFTIGMRGAKDGALLCERLEDYGNSKVNLEEAIITDQRELIKDVYKIDDEGLKKIPQVLVLYGDVSGIYNQGLSNFLVQPEYDDITIMWTDDSVGFVSQTPNTAEKERIGGGGMYYHAQYHSPDRSYMWLNSVSLFLEAEEMQRTYNEGIRNQWVLNVGDIKPGELSTELFLKIGWDAESYSDDKVYDYLVAHGQRDYHLSKEDAESFANAAKEYSVNIGTRRPEAYSRKGCDDFSTTSNGDEALIWLQRNQKVVDELSNIYNKLNEKDQSAFYQQIYYHALSARDAAEKYVYYWKNEQAVRQGRVGSSRIYTDMSKEAAQTVIDRVNDFGNCSNGKWQGYMASSDSLPIKDNAYSVISEEQIKDGIGAACEGEDNAGSGMMNFSSASPKSQHYFDVFSCNIGYEAWVAESDSDWIMLSKNSGNTSTEERIIVTVDWEKANDLKQSGSIVVKDKNGEEVARFIVNAEKSTWNTAVKGHTEAEGYVAVETEHYAENVAGSDGTIWKQLVCTAQHGNTMKTFPDHRVETDGNSAKLVYNVYFENAGKFNGTLYRVPTLSAGFDDKGESLSVRDLKVKVSVNGKNAEELKTNRPNSAMPTDEPIPFMVDVNQGWNTIEITRIDPTWIIDRFVIETKEGALKKSFLGPVESPNTIVNQEYIGNYVADLPDEIVDASSSIICMDIPDTELSIGESKKINAKASIATDAHISYSVESKDPTIVEVSKVDDGEFTVKALADGTSEITVTVSAEGYEPVVRKFNVKVYSTERSYQEQDGKLVISCGDAFINTSYAFLSIAQSRYTGTEFSWKSVNDGEYDGIQLTPIGRQGSDSLMGRDKWQWDPKNNTVDSPYLSFTVNAAKEGDYFFSFYSDMPNAAADSFHIFVNDAYQYQTGDGNKGCNAMGNIWHTCKQTIHLNEGKNVIRLNARESGIYLKQIMLSLETPKGLSGWQTSSEVK